MLILLIAFNLHFDGETKTALFGFTRTAADQQDVQREGFIVEEAARSFRLNS